MGEKVLISTDGINNFEHVLELFCCTEPENYSWSVLSNSECKTSLIVTIPIPGIYCVRVRAFRNARTGLCNLNINNESYFENIPVYSMGVTCRQETDQIYNTFTCKSSGNPILWIEEGPVIPGKISAFNNNYVSGQGCFNWGNNARIKKQFPRTVHATLISNYSSYNPLETCDLYIRCKNCNNPDVLNINNFPLLKADDAIQSSSASTIYNCFSWSGGITSYWEWPANEISVYYAPEQTEAFYNFYSSLGFTDQGLTADNVTVELIAIPDDRGGWDYSHAIVRKGADNNAHGYDWESKMGALERIFHPRNAVSGPLYGQIVEGYRKKDTDNFTKTLEEEIANGTSKIEYVDFTAEEQSYLSAKLNFIDASILSQFNTMYDLWKEVTETTVYSNLDKIADCDEYRNVLNLCKVNNGLVYAVFDKLNDGSIAAVQLVKDLTLAKNREVMERVRNNFKVVRTRTAVRLFRPMHSNAIAYVKELLGNENVALGKAKRQAGMTTGISYSNSNDFSVSTLANAVVVNFALPEQSDVYLNLLDLSGNTVCCATNGRQLAAGNHSVTLYANGSSKVCLVQLIVNGKVSVKKIILNK